MLSAFFGGINPSDPPQPLPIPIELHRDKEGLFIFLWLDVLQKVTPSLWCVVHHREGAGGWVRKKSPLPYAVFLRDREGAGGWVLGVYRGVRRVAQCFFLKARSGIMILASLWYC